MLVRSFFRIISSIFIIILIGSTVFIASGYWYLTRTPNGAQWFFEYALKRSLNAQDIRYERLEGTIADGIKVSNLEIADLNIFREHNVVLIQSLELAVPGFNVRQIWMKIANGRVKFPISDPIGFYGTLNHGVLNFHLYAGLIDVREIVTIFKNDLTLKNLKGTVKDASLTLNGIYSGPVLRGGFFLEDLRYVGFSLRDLPATVEYTLTPGKEGVLWNGFLSVPSGTVLSRLTKVELDESKLIFNGSFRNPALDIKGTSKVEQTVINFTLKGTKQKPEMYLTSDPPKAKNVLMLMLATGQELKLPEKTLGDGQLGSDSTSDFVDYFTFASDGGRFANNVGLSDFSVQMDENTQGLGIKKRVNDQLKVGVNLQETHATSGLTSDVTRIVGGQVQVADHITVGVDQKVTQTATPTQAQTVSQQPQGETDVTIKYKKSF